VAIAHHTVFSVTVRTFHPTVENVLVFLTVVFSYVPILETAIARRFSDRWLFRPTPPASDSLPTTTPPSVD